MSKAILVLDEMPAKCEDCPLYINAIAIGCVLDKSGYLYLSRTKRLEWCPLKPMPEQELCMEPDVWESAFAKGWNECLKEIGGNDE